MAIDGKWEPCGNSYPVNEPFSAEETTSVGVRSSEKPPTGQQDGRDDGQMAAIRIVDPIIRAKG